MLTKIFTVSAFAFFGCVFVDGAFQAAAELGYDVFEPFMSEEMLAERSSIGEIPDGCHWHGPQLHCGADEAMDIDLGFK